MLHYCKKHGSLAWDLTDKNKICCCWSQTTVVLLTCWQHNTMIYLLHSTKAVLKCSAYSLALGCRIVRNSTIVIGLWYKKKDNPLCQCIIDHRLINDLSTKMEGHLLSKNLSTVNLLYNKLIYNKSSFIIIKCP